MIRTLAFSIAIFVAPPAGAKNMFYVLASKWCDIGGKGPVRFEIMEDGSLIYDPLKGRVCQISRANNMEKATGDYDVVWDCDTGKIEETLTTEIKHDKDRERRFLLKRQKMTRSGKPETFEQCYGEDEEGN